MFKTIVVASDGSVHARRAVQIAGDLAAKYQARLVLLHVLGDGPVPESIARMADTEYMTDASRPNPTNVANVQGLLAVSERGADSPEHRDRIRQVVAEKILGEAEQVARSAGVTDIVCSGGRGDAADQILECARRETADLIVMGCRGLSNLKGLLMGSVSQKVCQRSDCSCIAVK